MIGVASTTDGRITGFAGGVWVVVMFGCRVLCLLIPRSPIGTTLTIVDNCSLLSVSA